MTGGGLHPARKYQPSTGAVKGSKILWPLTSARAYTLRALSLCTAKASWKPAAKPLTLPLQAVIGAYRVKPTRWEANGPGESHEHHARPAGIDSRSAHGTLHDMQRRRPGPSSGMHLLRECAHLHTY